jgi:hypothetical protein
MSGLGQGLHNIDWSHQQLAKFEKKCVDRRRSGCAGLTLQLLHRG